MNSHRTSRIANRAVTIAAACAFMSIATAVVAQDEPAVTLDEPAVNDGTETISGALPDGALVGVISTERGDITACHDAALARDSNLHGRMIATWTVTAAGAAIDAEIAETSLQDQELQDCVVAEIATWQFPAPSGGEVEVRYPFLFRNPDPTIAATDMAPMVVLAEVVATEVVAAEVAGAVVAETGEVAVGDVAVTDAAIGADVAQVQTGDADPIVVVVAAEEGTGDAAETVVVVAVGADVVVDTVTADQATANAELIAQQEAATAEAELRLQQAEDAMEAAEAQQDVAEDAADAAEDQQEAAEDAAADAVRQQERAERDARRQQDAAEDASEEAVDELAQREAEAEDAAEDAERRQAQAEEEAAEAERRREQAELEEREAAEELARQQLAVEEEAAGDADDSNEMVSVTMPTYAVAQNLGDWSNTFSHPDLAAKSGAVAQCIPTDFGRRERWTVYVPVSLDISNDGTVSNATYLGEDEDGTIQECVATVLDDTELDGVREARHVDTYTFYDTNHRELQVQRRGEIAAIGTLGTLSLATAIFMFHQADQDRDAAAEVGLLNEADFLNNRADQQRSLGQGLVVLTTVSYFAATMLFVNHRSIERNENPGIAIMPMFNGRAATIQVGGSF